MDALISHNPITGAKAHMQIQISADQLAPVAGNERQALFAIALALTRTAQDVQKEVRAQLPTRFTLRNGWTARNIRIEPASKSSLEATISAPNYMRKQETGEREIARKRYLAAPGPAVGNRIAPPSMRPAQVMRSKRTFVLETKSGKVGIAQRNGRKRLPLRILWWLTPMQDYQERFEFGDTGRDVVEKRFAIRFDEAFRNALSTAR